jgi:hypothetical protein
LRAAAGVSWAKAVAMKAETTRRPFLLACARALRMKWTRQRRQLAPSTKRAPPRIERRDFVMAAANFVRAVADSQRTVPEQ